MYQKILDESNYLGDRKFDDNTSPMAGFALDLYLAAVFLDDILAKRQAEPCSTRFCRKQRLKNFGHILFGYPAAGIFENYPEQLLCAHGKYFQFPSVGHCLKGVLNNILEDPINKDVVYQNFGIFGLKIGYYAHISGGRNPA